MKKNRKYYEVGYVHKSGSHGAMGQKHETLKGAQDQIEYLRNIQNPIYNKDRAYFITYVEYTETRQRIEYTPLVSHNPL